MTTTSVPRTPVAQTGRRQAPPRRRRAAPRWWADAGGVGAGLSLLIVVALWVSNGGVQQLVGGGAGAASALGRLTGLLAADLLLLQVLLMARVPLVERAFGQDRLARWHRWTGIHLVQPDDRAHRVDHDRVRRAGTRERVRASCGT